MLIEQLMLMLKNPGLEGATVRFQYEPSVRALVVTGRHKDRTVELYVSEDDIQPTIERRTACLTTLSLGQIEHALLNDPRTSREGQKP